MTTYPTKAEKWEHPSEPAGDGKSPAPAAETIAANTEKPTIPGDAAVAKAENTEKAESSPKAENGLSSISPDPAKETESRKAENVLMQIFQQAAANLSAAGVRVAISAGIKDGQHVVRFSVYDARLCDACHWTMIGNACQNKHCTAYSAHLD